MTCLCGDSECPSCGLAQGTLTLCEDCETRPPVAGEAYCQSCIDNAAEAAYERQQEAFYGGGEPVTLDEIHRAAWEEKQRLR